MRPLSHQESSTLLPFHIFRFRNERDVCRNLQCTIGKDGRIMSTCLDRVLVCRWGVNSAFFFNLPSVPASISIRFFHQIPARREKESELHRLPPSRLKQKHEQPAAYSTQHTLFGELKKERHKIAVMLPAQLLHWWCSSQQRAGWRCTATGEKVIGFFPSKTGKPAPSS